METINKLKQFFKSETSGSQNIDTKKLVSTALATSLILSPPSYQFLQANTGFQDLPGKVVVENISISNQANGTAPADTVMYDNGRNNFLWLRYAIEKGANKDPWSNVDVNNRADLYLIKQPNPFNGAPQYIANGDENNPKYDNSALNLESVRKTFTAALEKYNPNLGQISLKENKKNSEFEVKLQTKDKKLIYNTNLSLVVVSYLDYANNTSPDRLPAQYNYPDFIYNNVVRELPLGPEGQRIRFKTDGSLHKSFKLEELNDKVRQQSGLAIFLQDMSTKQIFVVGTCRFANLDGIDQPMYLNWNNHPESIFTEEMKEHDWKRVRIHTGLQKMTLNVRDIPTNTNLKKIGLEIGKSGPDFKTFDILGYDIPKSLQDNIKNLTFDPKTSHINIEFITPLTHLDPKTPIFSYITHFKNDNTEYSFSFQAKNLEVLDSNGNIPYFYLNNPKIFHHNQLSVRNNPLDFDKNTWINEEDIQEFLPNFGYLNTDPQYLEQYDVYPPSRVIDGEYKEKGDGRIDIQDLYHLVQAVSEQEELAKKIQEVNPDFVYPTIDQSIKARVLTQLCDILPPLGLELGQNQELTFKAIANQIEDICSIHGKTITKNEDSKSLFDKIKDFFTKPTTAHALSKRREEERA